MAGGIWKRKRMKKSAVSGDDGPTLFFAGRYLTGLPDLDRTEFIAVSFDADHAIFLSYGTPFIIGPQPPIERTRIPLVCIVELRVEKSVALDSSLTGNRLRDLGLIEEDSLKKRPHVCYFLLFWTWDGLTNETVFELPTLREANHLKNAFQERLATIK